MTLTPERRRRHVRDGAAPSTGASGLQHTARIARGYLSVPGNVVYRTCGDGGARGLDLRGSSGPGIGATLLYRANVYCWRLVGLPLSRLIRHVSPRLGPLGCHVPSDRTPWRPITWRAMRKASARNFIAASTPLASLLAAAQSSARGLIPPPYQIDLAM